MKPKDSHKPRRKLLSFMEWLEQRDKQQEEAIVEVRSPRLSRRKPQTTYHR